MSLDLQRILASKRALRQKLTVRPVSEKLRLLDDLRERTLAIRRSAAPATSDVVRESPARYRPIKPA
jgi:hypothetical protein